MQSFIMNIINVYSKIAEMTILYIIYLILFYYLLNFLTFSKELLSFPLFSLCSRGPLPFLSAGCGAFLRDTIWHLHFLIIELFFSWLECNIYVA